MKKGVIILLLFLLLIPFVFSQEIKDLVNDNANILTQQENIELEAILKQIYDSGEAEYVVVTVNSLEGKDIFSYSLELAQGNLGDTEKDNGLLLLVALEERKYQFQVGRGLEYILNDAKVGRIGRNYLVPNFKEENYGKGILEASLSVRSILLGDVNSTYYPKETKVNVNYYNAISSLISLIFFIAIISYYSKKKKGKYFDAATAAIIIFGGRRGGGFGGSGGFGGFGGGGFGGGGAGGGW